MAGDTEDEGANPRDEADGPSGLVESDDTTQADAGMAGGTGSDEGQATVNPLGTDAHDEDEAQGTG